MSTEQQQQVPEATEAESKEIARRVSTGLKEVADKKPDNIIQLAQIMLKHLGPFVKSVSFQGTKTGRLQPANE